MYHSGTALLDPHHLLTRAQVQPGMHIADIGCGATGHILFPAVQRMEGRGALYAVDIMQTVLERIHSRAQLHGVEDLMYPVWSDIERIGATRIPAASLDIVFITHVLHQLANIDDALTEVKRLLKAKSRLLILDWLPRGMGVYARAGRYVPQAFVTNWALQNGFVVQETFNPSNYSYGVILYRHA